MGTLTNNLKVRGRKNDEHDNTIKYLGKYNKKYENNYINNDIVYMNNVEGYDNGYYKKNDDDWESISDNFETLLKDSFTSSDSCHYNLINKFINEPLLITKSLSDFLKNYTSKQINENSTNNQVQEYLEESLQIASRTNIFDKRNIFKDISCNNENTKSTIRINYHTENNNKYLSYDILYDQGLYYNKSAGTGGSLVHDKNVDLVTSEGDISGWGKQFKFYTYDFNGTGHIVKINENNCYTPSKPYLKPIYTYATKTLINTSTFTQVLMNGIYNIIDLKKTYLIEFVFRSSNVDTYKSIYFTPNQIKFNSSNNITETLINNSLEYQVLYSYGSHYHEEHNLYFYVKSFQDFYGATNVTSKFYYNELIKITFWGIDIGKGDLL